MKKMSGLWLGIFIISGVFQIIHPGDIRCMQGKWELSKEKSVNVDKLLEAQGHSWATRKAMVNMSMTQTIRIEGNKVHVFVESTMMNKSYILILDGKERMEKSPFGKIFHTKYSLLPDHGFIAVSRDEEGNKSTTYRRCENNGKTMVNKIKLEKKDGKVVSGTRVFIRVP